MREEANFTDQHLITEEDLWLRNVIYTIRMFFLPVIVAGTITNIFNLVVLRTKAMSQLSTSVYLLALACADFGVMYFELFRIWFEWVDIVDPTLYFTDVYCKMANFFNDITRDFSNWLIACLALERTIMVARPYKAKELCTVVKARLVVLVLFLCISVPNAYTLVFSVAQKRTWWVCWEDPRSTVAPIVAAIVQFTVGYTVVVVVFLLNVTLAFLVFNQNLFSAGRGKQQQGNHRRLTRTLLLVAVLFLVCETPRMIMSFLCKFTDRTPLKRIVLNVTYVISGINHASNFFIYIMSSPRFRRVFIQALQNAKNRIRGTKTTSSNAQYQSRIVSGPLHSAIQEV